MNYENFKKEVTKGLEEKGYNYCIDGKLIHCFKGFGFWFADETWYSLSDAYERCIGDVSVSSIVNEIIKHGEEFPIGFDFEGMEYKIDKSDILPSLISKEEALELDEDIVKYPFFDMCFFFRRNIEDELEIGLEGELTSTNIRDDDWPYLNDIGINNAKELLDVALENLYNLGKLRINKYENICYNKRDEVKVLSERGYDFPIWAVSGCHSVYGSAILGSKDALNQVLKKLDADKLVILPFEDSDFIVFKYEDCKESIGEVVDIIHSEFKPYSYLCSRDEDDKFLEKWISESVYIYDGANLEILS